MLLKDHHINSRSTESHYCSRHMLRNSKNIIYCKSQSIVIQKKIDLLISVERWLETSQPSANTAVKMVASVAQLLHSIGLLEVIGLP